jgi:hypothetical protein
MSIYNTAPDRKWFASMSMAWLRASRLATDGGRAYDCREVARAWVAEGRKKCPKQRGALVGANSYATDGKCHNAEPGTYGHECGKPAAWIGTTAGGFSAGYCADCKRNGSEARICVSWTPAAAPAPVWADTPATRCSVAALPLLVEAHTRLHGVAAPHASRIAERIGALLDSIIDVAGDVEAYGNKWCAGDMGELARRVREATREYNAI